MLTSGTLAYVTAPAAWASRHNQDACLQDVIRSGKTPLILGTVTIVIFNVI